MGDRKNRIMFGPEWLRNLDRDQSDGRTNANQNAGSGTPRPGANGGGAPAEPGGPAAAGTSPNTPAGTAPTSSPTTNTRNTNPPLRVRFANQRYGREEMLALSERNSVAPEELKHFDLLYLSREKQPFALNTFEEVRENLRGGSATAPMSSEQRYGASRSRGAATGEQRGAAHSSASRAAAPTEPRGRGRLAFMARPPPGHAAARGPAPMHGTSVRTPTFNTGPDEEPIPSRSWSNSNGGAQASRTGETGEWMPNKLFRRRPNHHTNWRQASREEGEEWRNNIESSGRPITRSDKWEREWGDSDRRPTQDRPLPWSATRRGWMANDANNEENLPEWAVDNAETSVAGTFDSSGAFHGYSNDDSNLPKSQETNHPVTRSQTHGSFSRGKEPEEGSEEWWSSEKAKKLSQKKASANDRKPRKVSSPALANPKPSTSYSQPQQNTQSKPFVHFSEPVAKMNTTLTDDSLKGNVVNKKFAEPKSIGTMTRPETGFTESIDVLGEYQSVMINPSNDLRQKHQNIVNQANDRQRRNSGSLYKLLHGIKLEDNSQVDVDAEFEDMLDMSLKESGHPSSSLPTQHSLQAAPAALPIHSLKIPPPNLRMPPPNLQMPPPNLQALPPNIVVPPPNIQRPTQRLPMPPRSGRSNAHNPEITTPGMGNVPGLLNSGSTAAVINTPSMHNFGVQNQALNTALGIGTGGGHNVTLREVSLPPVLQTAQRNVAAALRPPPVSAAFTADARQMPLVSTNSLFMDHTNQLQPMPTATDPNVQDQQQNSLYPIGVPRAAGTIESMYATMLHQSVQSSQTVENPADQWFYEDPAEVVQGPFSSLEMLRWYEAGFFNSSLMVRRATETQMRPLGSYSMIPFGFLDNLPNYYPLQMPFEPRPITSQEMLNRARVNLNDQEIAKSVHIHVEEPIPMPSTVRYGNEHIRFGLQPTTSLKPLQMGHHFVKPVHNQAYQPIPMPTIIRYDNDQIRFGLQPTTSLQPVPMRQDIAKPLHDQGYEPIPMPPKKRFGIQPATSLQPVPMRQDIAKPLHDQGYEPIPMPPKKRFGIQPATSLQPVPMRQDIAITVHQAYQPIPMPTIIRYDNDQIRFGLQPPTCLQPRPMETLWGQPGLSDDYLWTLQRVNQGDVANNVPTVFWGYPQNASAMNDIVKEMKTEDQILAQLRATQNIPISQPTTPFVADNESPPPVAAGISPSEEDFHVRATPDLEKLQQLIENETQSRTSDCKSESEESETKSEVPDKVETPAEPVPAVKSQPAQQKGSSGTKSSKQAKSEPEKPAKTKENTKSKKKNKEEKKEEPEPKVKEEEVKSEKPSAESSPSKNKKEDKQTKKDLEREKKEWLKEGFTIVKGAEKNNNKENKKKVEEAKALEELERKKKDEEKLAAGEIKKKKPILDTLNEKQQEQQQRQILESLIKRAPWSAANQSAAGNKGGLSMSEIQRLEREKKLEEIKEQQHMMHLIAQQQATAMAREQEIQANLAWARNNLDNKGTGPTLAEIQAETRRQSAAAALVTTQSIEEIIPLPPLIPLPTNAIQWGNSTNGAGFWDTPSGPTKVEKQPQEPAKPAEPKPKKKVPIPPTIKREPSPNSEFEAWCTTALALWRTKIDVPTFVGFLKDIESPYEVKDYVKCYLGDTKESNDFAKQFLERRSKLLRVGMVTPSDDLCSPAIAVNPRVPLSEYQEVKGKGKKSKKNKMLKVDARILGFSVTASEDRINVGDIDTA